MPYLNLDPSYPEHPKTIRLIGLLGEMADALPVRLWAYCARVHPRDGYLKGYSSAEVEAIIKWRGEPDLAVKSFVSVGFIRKVVGGYICNDWKDHEGHLEAFSRRGKQAAKKRWSSYATSIASSNAKKILSNTPAVPAVPTIPTNGLAGSGDLAKPSTLFQKFMNGILADYYNKFPGDPDPAKREAVNQAYKRFARAGTYIFKAAENNPERARECVDEVVRRMNAWGLSSQLDTVAKWADEYFSNPEAFKNATKRETARR